VQSRSYDPAFVEDDANIVLQSSDGIYYRVSSYTLRTTSGFFRGMMTLPAPSNDQNTDDVIVLGETSKVLGTLLRMIGGLAFVRWESIDELEEILAAAEKYDMPGPIATIEVNLTTSIFLEQPLRLYAIAARYGLEEAAKVASKGTLSLSIHDEEHIPILERIPVSYVLRLFRLHQKRKDEFQKLVKQNKTLGVATCSQCGRNFGHGALKGITYFAQCMVSKVDLQPAGNELLDGMWRTWPEASERACWAQHCSQQPITHYQDTITMSITNYIKSLSCTI